MENGIRAICEDDLAWKIEKKLFLSDTLLDIGYTLLGKICFLSICERSTCDEKAKKKYT